MFKVNKKDIRTTCFDAFILIFEHISHFSLVILLLTFLFLFKNYKFAGKSVPQ